jgi:hypothetical protein
MVDEAVWSGPPDDVRELPGEIVLEPEERDGWLAVETANGMESANGAEGADFGASWTAVRDANIRPYVDWVVPAPVSLPVAAVKGPPPGAAPRHENSRPNQGGNNGPGARRDKGRRRRRRRPAGGPERPREPNRGPRLPGMYNPGGD